MSEHEPPNGPLSHPGHRYQGNQISGDARVQLGDKYNISREDPLRLLPFAKNAPFNSYDRQHEPACLPDTRVDLLQGIYDWANGRDGQDKQNIFWLSGLAGTGKSTISRTVARRYSDQKRLGASFFFSKGGGDVSHAGMFVTSLAVQLTFNIPTLRQYICDAVIKQSNIVSLSLAEQWRYLILGPLSNLKSESYPYYILVIDALDECEGNNKVRIILELLAEVRSLKTIRLRVFLTSRPEVPIRYSIYHIPQAEHRDFVLHNIPLTIVNHDIALFLEYNLGIIRQEWTLGADWPGEVVLRQLVLYACGRFIWAATACHFIRKGGRFARKRLDTILQGSSAITEPEKHLNEIYLAVLKQSISPDYLDEEKKEVYDILKHTLGSLVVLLSPLSAFSLSKLLHLPKEDIDQTFKDLYAILDIPEDPTRPLRLHHPSFRDFLLNRDRCGDFWVDEKHAHQILATSCIQLLSQTLKKDICELHAPGSQVTQVKSSRIKKFLPPEVQYACLYWIQHLQKSGSQIYDGEEAHRFIEAHLLHWLEALGWMGKTSEGIRAILSLETHIPVNKSPNLYAFIYDTKRFALYNYSMIEQVPLQLYCSALIFAPENSIIRRQFENCIPDWIQMKPKVQAHWNAALQVLEGHSDRVKSVAFSPDGQRVVSGSYDHTVRLWDAATGTLQHTLGGDFLYFESVAFSPDGQRIVSGSHDIQLWDAATGTLQHTLNGHSSWVYSVAFSPDSQRIVSGSHDHTIRLWDAATGALQHTLERHTSYVYSVAFSPDSQRIVSGSHDHTIRLWDAATGALQHTLERHTSYVYSVAFSPDSQRIVSGSHDHTIRLWDAATGALQHTLERHTSYVYSIAFSPDSQRIVSGSHDKTVRLWDAATGALQYILEGHTEFVNSVAFSRDGQRVVSGSDDGTIRLWDLTTSALQQSLENPAGGVESVAFSSDGQRVVSLSGGIRLWDATTGALQHTLEGHLYFVKSVAFSPDGQRVVSGSYDETVRLWDAATGTLQHTLGGDLDSLEYRMRGGNWTCVSSVAFSPDGQRVVSGSSDNTVRLWDATTGTLEHILGSHGAPVDSVAFSPDSQRVVSGSDDHTVRLWDTATGALQHTLKGHTGWVESVAFSPDGRRIVSGSRGGTVRLWDAATGALQHILKGHTDHVKSVAFSSDGQCVISGSDDRTIRLWDATTGALQQTLKAPRNIVNSVAAFSDGRVHGLFLSDEWIIEEGVNFLWLPLDYRANSIAIRDNNIVLGHLSGKVSFFKFKQALKVI